MASEQAQPTQQQAPAPVAVMVSSSSSQAPTSTKPLPPRPVLQPPPGSVQHLVQVRERQRQRERLHQQQIARGVNYLHPAPSVPSASAPLSSAGIKKRTDTPAANSTTADSACEEFFDSSAYYGGKTPPPDTGSDFSKPVMSPSYLKESYEYQRGLAKQQREQVDDRVAWTELTLAHGKKYRENKTLPPMLCMDGDWVDMVTTKQKQMRAAERRPQPQPRPVPAAAAPAKPSKPLTYAKGFAPKDFTDEDTDFCPTCGCFKNDHSESCSVKEGGWQARKTNPFG